MYSDSNQMTMGSNDVGLLIFALFVLFGKVVYGGDPSLKWISDATEPITHVYLDFDNTITTDGFSEAVRNSFCRTEDYPDCYCGNLCDNTMVRYPKIYFFGI